MAKSAQGFPVSRGSGNNLSLFSLDSARLRETVIIADSDQTGEALHAELPAHDSPDRGSSLKIGGRAAAAPFSVVADADRTDAWYTQNGQLGTISTIESGMVYDAGRRDVHMANGVTTALNNGSFTVIAGAPGLKTKLLLVIVFPTAWTTQGVITVRDGVAGANILIIGACPTPGVGQQFNVTMGGIMLGMSSVNTTVEIFYTGQATLGYNLLYYQAP